MFEPKICCGNQRVLAGLSPIAESIADLQTLVPKWRVEIGVPEDSPECERRAQQTAVGLGLSAAIAVELGDCNYGDWRGRTLDNLQSEDPDAVRTWLTDPNAAPHGGESISYLISRVGSWIDRQRDVGHVLCVTHPAVIRCAIIHALHSPAQSFWRIDVAPLSLTDLRFNGTAWTLRVRQDLY